MHIGNILFNTYIILPTNECNVIQYRLPGIWNTFRICFYYIISAFQKMRTKPNICVKREEDLVSLFFYLKKHAHA